jgi:hypothetical protein
MIDLTAEFLAKGGKITQVAQGKRTASEKQLYVLGKGEVFAAADKRTGYTLSDGELLAVVEREGCES